MVFLIPPPSSSSLLVQSPHLKVESLLKWAEKEMVISTGQRERMEQEYQRRCSTEASIEEE
ncbi:hypothetical protein EON65_45805 [archaeon]|nr:MAG: hypothetical protein EON65_45805 [archaeon]